jgi:hypothetical protein
LQVVSLEACGLIHVLKQSAGSGDQNVHALQPDLLLLDGLAADDETSREGVEAADGPQNLKDLHGQLAGGRDDEGAQAVRWAPFLAEQIFEHRQDKGQGLAAARLRSPEDVFAFQSQRNGFGLDGRQVGELGGS